MLRCATGNSGPQKTATLKRYSSPPSMRLCFPQQRPPAERRPPRDAFDSARAINQFDFDINGRIFNSRPFEEMDGVYTLEQNHHGHM